MYLPIEALGPLGPMGLLSDVLAAASALRLTPDQITALEGDDFAYAMVASDLTLNAARLRARILNLARLNPTDERVDTLQKERHTVLVQLDQTWLTKRGLALSGLSAHQLGELGQVLQAAQARTAAALAGR